MPSAVFCQFSFVILGEVEVSSLGVLLFTECLLVGLGGIPFSGCMVTPYVPTLILIMVCLMLWGSSPYKVGSSSEMASSIHPWMKRTSGK